MDRDRRVDIVETESELYDETERERFRGELWAASRFLFRLCEFSLDVWSGLELRY